MNYKYQIGQEIEVSGTIKITGCQRRKDGMNVYNTDLDCYTLSETALNRLVYGTGYHPSEVALKPEQPKREDKHKFKVGDRVMCVSRFWNCRGKVGTIINVDSDGSSVPYYVKFQNKKRYWLCEGEVEPCTEPKPEPEKAEPEYYSGKVVCVEATDRSVTLGKVYTVEKGVFTWNSGTRSDTKATTIEQFNNWFVAAKFIEFKGE